MGSDLLFIVLQLVVHIKSNRHSYVRLERKTQTLLLSYRCTVGRSRQEAGVSTSLSICSGKNIRQTVQAQYTGTLSGPRRKKKVKFA